MKGAMETALTGREETIAQLTKQIQNLKQDLDTMGGDLQSVSALEREIVELKHSRKREMEKYYEDREAMDNADRKKAEQIQALSTEIVALKHSHESVLGESQVSTLFLLFFPIQFLNAFPLSSSVEKKKKSPPRNSLRRLKSMRRRPSPPRRASWRRRSPPSKKLSPTSTPEGRSTSKRPRPSSRSTKLTSKKWKRRAIRRPPQPLSPLRRLLT